MHVVSLKYYCLAPDTLFTSPKPLNMSIFIYQKMHYCTIWPPVCPDSAMRTSADHPVLEMGVAAVLAHEFEKLQANQSSCI